MKIKFSKFKFYIVVLSVFISLQSCTAVQPWEREYLADPIMEGDQSLRKQSLDDKFFSTQEGSTGGVSGVSGGCGCAK